MRCGLVNFAETETCRRCDAILSDPIEVPPVPSRLPDINIHIQIKRVLVVAGTIAGLLFVCWSSLLFTSKGLHANQRELLAQAIDLLDENGFSKEVFVLRRVTAFRATDNWWNLYVGHQQAYAATNFPFEVVTLYPRFFEVAGDDTERAIILLHESHHLFGDNEAEALEGVWRAKLRLGWTAENYSHTRVWKNTREWTLSNVPQLFACGAEGRSDCLE